MKGDKLNKDKSIIHLINHLGTKYGFDNIIVSDFWDGDLCAVGLSGSQNKILIYLSTFNRDKGFYFLSVGDMDDPTITISEFDNIQILEVEEKIEKYLALN